MEVVSYLIEAHIFRKKADDLEFLLMKRAKHENFPGVWQMVTGTIKENENAYDTALREIKEETGLNPEQFWVVPFMNSFYAPERNAVCMVPVFAALVNPNSEIKISKEHSEFKWVGKEEAKKLLAWYGQRQSVDIIYEYFTNERSLLEFVGIKF